MGNTLGRDPTINPIKVTNVDFLKFNNKYLINFEKKIIPIKKPNPNMHTILTEYISINKFDILSIKNSYVPRIIKIQAPEIPGKIMAKEQITPHRKIYKIVNLGSKEDMLKIMKLDTIEKISKKIY